MLNTFNRSRESHKVFRKIVVLSLASLFMSGCLSEGGGGVAASNTSSASVVGEGESAGNTGLSSKMKDPILRVSLTDAPNKNYKAVFVNIAHLELFVGKGSTEKRVIIGQNLGMVDLLQLQNGILLPIAEFSIPDGVEIREIRLVLNNIQNYAVREDDSICDLQTPSGQQSGVKIKLSSAFAVEKGHIYSMVVDFDAKKSIVTKGNGGCLLKPVIRIPAVMKQPISDDDDSNSSESEADGSGDDQGQGDNTDTEGSNETDETEPTPVTDGTDSNVDETSSGITEEEISFFDENGAPIPSDQLGFDPHDSSTYPDGITADDLYMYF